MVVRIPGPDEPASFGPPVAAHAAADPFSGLPDETKAAMTYMQARDDAVFIASSLADLSVRHRQAALASEAQVLNADDPLAAERHVDGFARRLDGGISVRDTVFRIAVPAPGYCPLEISRFDQVYDVPQSCGAVVRCGGIGADLV